MTLWNRQNHGVLHRAGVELGRTDKVADVFQNHQIETLGAQPGQSLPGHLGVQMAHAAGVQLNGLGAGLGNGAGVHVGVNVGLHHADAQLILQRSNRAAQCRGFAGPRRTH